MKLNETPVRTSKNFKINNIELGDLKLPKSSNTFKNVECVGKCEMLSSLEVRNLKYGIGNVIYENVVNNANSKIKLNIETSEVLRIIYTFDDDNTNLINYIEINARNNADIIIEYKSNTKKMCFLNSIIYINANDGSNVNISVVNLLNDVSNSFISMENNIFADANVQYTVIDLGTKNSLQNYFANIVGNKANNDLKSIYLGSGNEVKDINYIAELTGEKTSVNIEVQGALKDNSKKNFKGTINFKRGCKNAVGDENEYCMLLSDKANSIALPMLLCTEEEVEGNHSTASGKLDDKEIFYIMSRGLDKKEATKLIVKARLNSIVQRISDEGIKNEVLQVIDERLN